MPKANTFQVHGGGGAPQNQFDHFHLKHTEINAQRLVVSFHFRFKLHIVIESVPEIWEHLLDKIATYMVPNGRSGLSRYAQHYDQLNTALMRNDNHGIVELFHIYITIQDENIPFFNDKAFLRACNRKADNSNRNDMLMLIQHLSTNTGSNTTFLQIMNNYFKPLANHINHVLGTYRPKTIDGCQKKPKH